MKKYLILLIILFLHNIAFGAPSNTLSITPVAVDATTITASDENSRNNVITTIYNAHTHTDVSQVSNTLNIGDTLAGDKIINAYNADTNKPYIKYDDTNNYWVFSTDGSAPSAILQGTGIIIEGATDDTSETTISVTDPTADRTITLPNNTGTVILSAPSVSQTIDLTTNTTISSINIDGGTIDGVTIGGASAPTVTNLGTVTTCDINGGTIDGVTIGATSAPTVTNLGTVTTADINGGTMDGVQIGGTTATGELIVNDTNDDADGLGSQGTSGQFLQSAGAGANPTWVSAVSQVNDTDTGTTYNQAGVTFLTKDKTITSGNTVLLIATGYMNPAGSAQEVTTTLRQGTTVVDTSVMNCSGVGVKMPFAASGIVTGLSGSITFSVVAQTTDIDSGTIYGNLSVIEF